MCCSTQFIPWGSLESERKHQSVRKYLMRAHDVGRLSLTCLKFNKASHIRHSHSSTNAGGYPMSPFITKWLINSADTRQQGKLPSVVHSPFCPLSTVAYWTLIAKYFTQLNAGKSQESAGFLKPTDSTWRKNGWVHIKFPSSWTSVLPSFPDSFYMVI